MLAKHGLTVRPAHERTGSDGDARLAELEVQEVAVERHHQHVGGTFEDRLAEHLGVRRVGIEEHHGRLAARR